MVDSSDSDSNRFEIRHKIKARKHDTDDEEDISGTEAMLRRRKQPRKTTTTTTKFLSSSRGSKMAWSKNNELVILKGIVDYEKENGFSYGTFSDQFYRFMKDLIDADFSKTQLLDKVRKLKKRFRDNVSRSQNGKGLSFTNANDEEAFGLSMIIWAGDEKECASSENAEEQPKAEVLVSDKDEQEPVSYTRMVEEKKSEEEELKELAENTKEQIMNLISHISGRHDRMLDRARGANDELNKVKADLEAEMKKSAKAEAELEAANKELEALRAEKEGAEAKLRSECARLRKSRGKRVKRENLRVTADLKANYAARLEKLRMYLDAKTAFDKLKGTIECLKVMEEKGGLIVSENIMATFLADKEKFRAEMEKMEDVVTPFDPETELVMSPLHQGLPPPRYDWFLPADVPNSAAQVGIRETSPLKEEKS